MMSCSIDTGSRTRTTSPGCAPSYAAMKLRRSCALITAPSQALARRAWPARPWKNARGRTCRASPSSVHRETGLTGSDRPRSDARRRADGVACDRHEAVDLRLAEDERRREEDVLEPMARHDAAL